MHNTTSVRMQDLVKELTRKIVTLDGEITYLYQVTPSWVTKLNLDNRTVGVNRENRQHSVEHVNKLKSLIINGEWIEDLDPILYINEAGHAWDGKLVSGQHRLRAIEKANIPCYVNFKGIPVEVAAYVDTGRRRTMADNASMVLGMPKSIMTMMTHYYGFVRVSEGFRYTPSSGNALSHKKNMKSIEHAYLNWGVTMFNVHSNYKQAHLMLNLNVYRAFLAVLKIGQVDQSIIDKFVTNTMNTDCREPAMRLVFDSYLTMHKTSVDPYIVH